MRIGFVESRLYDMQAKVALFPSGRRGKHPVRPRQHNRFDAPHHSMYNPLFPESAAVSFAGVTGIFLNNQRGFSIMYAVIKTGGKQYKVVAGEKLKVEQIPADIGSELTIDQVLAVGEGESIKFGAPLVEGASVRVTVVSHGRHDKVRIFKMRRRKHYQKRQGHRQNYTEIQVVAING
jgi:large subunit ribosomal protein L21